MVGAYNISRHAVFRKGPPNIPHGRRATSESTIASMIFIMFAVGFVPQLWESVVLGIKATCGARVVCATPALVPVAYLPWGGGVLASVPALFGTNRCES